jgi:pilus assembly protein FimV
LKLLEIFYSTDNRHAFETYANELAKAGKKDDAEFWTKVTEMGSKICQDSTLFSSKEIGFSSRENTIFEKKTANLFESRNVEKVEKNEVTDIKENNLGLSSFGKSSNNEAIKEMSQTPDSSLDFDLNFFEDKVIDELQNIESNDFDLSIMATKSGKLSETIESVASTTLDIKVKDEFDSFDFDFGSIETEVKGIVKIDASAVKEASDNS